MPSHQEIDRQLRRLARQRAGLDAEEARWLRHADEQNSWRALGYVHALEYLEEVFGYAPRTAKEKLRVAKELGELRSLEAELASGSMPYSIVRELTRVATPHTEASWIENARGRNYRQVEQMLSGRKKGDAPTDDMDPALVEHDVRWKLDAATRSLLRETRRHIEDELGHALDDATFVDVICRRAIDGGLVVDSDGTEVTALDGTGSGAVHSSGPKTMSRPSAMIHLTTCRTCKATVQHGAGVPFALTKEQVELAECDAIIVDDEDGKRATTTIPAKTRRLVLERDQYRCRFPGCRSTRNLDAHHLEHREHGGDHSSGNLATLCRGHHKLNHNGVITASGDAYGELLFTRNGVEIRGEVVRGLNVGAGPTPSQFVEQGPAMIVMPGVTIMSKCPVTPRASISDGGARYRQVERNTLAKAALQQAGYKSATAARAVERATGRVRSDAPLEVLLREAFRHCT